MDNYFPPLSSAPVLDGMSVSESFVPVTERATSSQAESQHYLNPFAQFRIWFSPDPSICMSIKNKFRLVHFHVQHPNIVLKVVYSSALLNEEGVKDQIRFARQQLWISWLDIEGYDFVEEPLNSHIVKESGQPIFTDSDRKILQCAQQEIQHFLIKKGGNLGAASDCVRCLTPLLAWGMYTDFDTQVAKDSYDNLNPLLIESALVCNVLRRDGKDHICNDLVGLGRTIGGVISQEGEDLIEGVQKKIIDHYTRPLLSVFSQMNSRAKPIDAFTHLIAGTTFPFLNLQKNGLSIPLFRWHIERSSKNLYMLIKVNSTPTQAAMLQRELSASLFSRLVAAFKNDEYQDFPWLTTHAQGENGFTLDEVALIKSAMAKSFIKGIADPEQFSSDEHDLKQYLSTINMWELPPMVREYWDKRIESIKAVKKVIAGESINGDDCFIALCHRGSLISPNSRRLLLGAVIYFTGPYVWRDLPWHRPWLMKRAVQKDIPEEPVERLHSQHAYSQNHTLNKMFQPCHANVRANKSLLFSNASDLSWMIHESSRIASQEKKIEEKAHKIARAYRCFTFKKQVQRNIDMRNVQKKMEHSFKK